MKMMPRARRSARKPRSRAVVQPSCLVVSITASGGGLPQVAIPRPFGLLSLDGWVGGWLGGLAVIQNACLVAPFACHAGELPSLRPRFTLVRVNHFYQRPRRGCPRTWCERYRDTRIRSLRT